MANIIASSTVHMHGRIAVAMDATGVGAQSTLGGKTIHFFRKICMKN